MKTHITRIAYTGSKNAAAALALVGIVGNGIMSIPKLRDMAQAGLEEKTKDLPPSIRMIINTVTLPAIHTLLTASAVVGGMAYESTVHNDFIFNDDLAAEGGASHWYITMDKKKRYAIVPLETADATLSINYIPSKAAKTIATITK